MYEVVGWGRGKRSWSIDADVIPGDTADATEKGPWPRLNALLDRTFRHESGVELRAAMLAIDSGFNTQHVYNWARQHPMSRVIAVKGVEGSNVLVGAPSPVELSRNGKKLKRGYKVWPVAGGVAKSELYGWLKLGPPTDEARAEGATEPPGYCAFPQYGEDYFKQLTAEQLVATKNRKGFVVFTWELIPARENHYLDARVYARAAAAVVGLDRFGESDWTVLERSVGEEPPARVPAVAAPVQTSGQEPPKPRPPRRESWLGARRGGWLRGGR
jgi:phage terminase large subunit GpA-like protein